MIVGTFYKATGEAKHGPPTSLLHKFLSIHPSLQQIYGHVTFPKDNGNEIVCRMRQKNSIIFGCSNASLKENRASHARVISLGDIDDLSNPNLHICGHGPVHGYQPNLSSARSKLQGITVVTIILKLLFEFHSYTVKAQVVCGNQGVINKCKNGSLHRLRHHREANVDLYLTQRDLQSSLNLDLQWVKGHADKQPWESLHDLKSQQLSREETYNVWCDKAATKAWLQGDHSSSDPEVSVTEKWVFYSMYPSYH